MLQDEVEAIASIFCNEGECDIKSSGKLPFVDFVMLVRLVGRWRHLFEIIQTIYFGALVCCYIAFQTFKLKGSRGFHDLLNHHLCFF